MHEQYKPEAQASEYHGRLTRLRFGLGIGKSLKLSGMRISMQFPVTRRVVNLLRSGIRQNSGLMEIRISGEIHYGALRACIVHAIS